MGETLDALRRLQEVEHQMADLQRAEERRERQVRIQKRNIAKSSALLDQRQAEIRQRQMEIDRLEMDIKSREETLAKHRAALNKARTNKEYASILTTINTEKVDSAKLEARELEVMADLDRLRAEAEKIKGEQKGLEERLAHATAELEDYLAQTREKRESLQRQRDEVAESIPGQALQTFERVAERHEGEALAVILRLHPKRDEYACGGCNMKTTLEIINALQTRDEIQCCDACGRILYLDS